MIFILLAAALFLGASLTGAILSYFFQCQPEFMWKIWSVIAFLSASGLGTGLYFFFRKKKPKEIDLLKADLEKFQKECKIAIRGHLKASILFWIHFYRKEKAKSLDETKKEIFHDLKREFGDVRWIESMLEHIRQELTRYKK